MTIDIHFSCNTLEELREAMQRFLSAECPDIRIEPRISVALEEPEAPETPAAPAVVEEPVVTETVAEAAKALKEATWEALCKLRREKGAAVVRAILARHGADNFPKLNPSEYAKVLEEARQ